MTALPSQLSYAATPADSTPMVAADVRNPLASILTTVNSLITALGSALAGQFLGGTPNNVTWAFPPGHIYGYTQIVTNATSTATSSATATAAITGGALTFDGSTAIWVEVFTPIMTHTAATTTVVIELYDGATDVAQLAELTIPSNNNGAQMIGKIKLTPSAASHTYSARVWSSGAGTATMFAGAGSAAAAAPAYLLVTQA